MTTSSSFSNLQPCYYIDLNEAHELHHHQALHHDTTPIDLLSLHPQSSFASASSLSSSSSSPSPYSNQFQEQARGSNVDDFASYGRGSYDQAEINKRTNNILKFSICRKEDKNISGGGGSDGGVGGSEINRSYANWLPPKMRLTKKMVIMEEDQRQDPPPFRVGSDTNLISRPLNSKDNNNSKNDNTMIRVCSDCNTTKTPLWRSGPRGPKSLCNACGIRQRKARRAMAAAAASGSFISNPLKKAPNRNNGSGAQKKPCKVGKKKLWFEEFSMKLTNKLSLHQIFPKEDKEAAILLMALSSGLVQG